MAKARRALARAFPTQDVIIEVLDARMPHASSNPIVSKLRKDKPCIKVLTKSDLADPAVTREWTAYLQEEHASTQKAGRVVVMATRTDRPGEIRSRIPELCRKLAPTRSDAWRTVRVMVVGIPNVGKSTLINVLLGRTVAKVRNEPAVTRMEQRVELPSGITLSDNPGLLWPSLSEPNVGYRLAVGGAIAETALDYEEIGSFAASFFLERYPKLVLARYKLKTLPSSGEDLLKEVGRRRGCLRSGNTIDRHKAADILIHDFRAGALGLISLETPDDLCCTASEQPLEQADWEDPDAASTEQQEPSPHQAPSESPQGEGTIRHPN